MRVFVPTAVATRVWFWTVPTAGVNVLLRQLAHVVETDVSILHTFSTFTYRESGFRDTLVSEQTFFLDNQCHVGVDGLVKKARTIASVEPDGSVVTWTKIKDGSVVLERRTLLSRTAQVRVLEHLKPKKLKAGTPSTAPSVTPRIVDEDDTEYYSSCLIRVYYNRLETAEERAAGMWVCMRRACACASAW